LRVGDRVRVLAVPDLAGMSPRGLAAARPVFARLVGTYRRIAAFDERGNAELVVRLRGGPHAGLHCVAIEPDLLALRRPR
jgi:hypothetical protein